MKFALPTIKTLGLIVAAAASTGAQAANLITNGDFANPAQGGGWNLYSSIPGWTSGTRDTIEVGGNGVYGLSCYAATCQNLEVNANTFGIVSQTVNGLTPGHAYTLSYAYGGRPGGGVQKLNVSFGGQTLVQDTAGYGVWTLNTFHVVATAATETLTFASVNTAGLGGLPSYGNEITGVSLVGSAPEPAAWAMMFTGFVLAGGALRRGRTVARAAMV